MPLFNWTVRRTVTATGRTISGAPLNISADGETFRSVDWSSAPTNKEIDIDFVLSRVVGIAIVSTQAGTLKTNSSSVPDATVTLVANREYVWTNVDGTANPFGSVDVSKLFLTSAVATGNIQISILYDSTP